MSNHLSAERLAKMRVEVAKARGLGDFDHEECRVMGYDLAALLTHIDAQAEQLWPIVATRNAALNRAEAAEQAIQRVRDICMDTDGNYLDNEDTCNTVGGIIEALDGGQE